jgi:hypothetical protein
VQNVGHYLQLEAIQQNGQNRDEFARSAFNRYYYSAYLDTRALVAALDPTWASIAHKTLPELLQGTVRKKFRAEKARAEKSGDGQLATMLDGAVRATVNLARLLSVAYSVRVVADYQPDEKVNFSSAERFSLKNIDITTAHAWNQQTRIWITSIHQAWSQISV